MNRGHRYVPIFLDDQDRRLFLQLASDSLKATGVEAAAYCLMGNHFHLIVHCPQSGLSAMMQRLAGRYTRAFNARHGGDGPLFRSRFASTSITTDAQLLAVTRYVHRNPLELRFRIDDYPWSSYASYLTGVVPEWLTTAFVLQLQGGSVEHRRFVEAPQPADKFTLANGTRTAPDLAEHQALRVA